VSPHFLSTLLQLLQRGRTRPFLLAPVMPFPGVKMGLLGTMNKAASFEDTRTGMSGTGQVAGRGLAGGHSDGR
jgi:hypothetical protein